MIFLKYIYYRIKNFLLFGLIKEPRPDFSKEPVEILPIDLGKGYRERVIFVNVNPLKAQEQKWFHNFFEYQFLAAMEFSRRYPSHTMFKKIRKGLEISDRQILDIAKGKLKLDIKRKGDSYEISAD